MYFISAVIENNQVKVALYDNEYKLLMNKECVSADPAKLCLDVITESGIKASDVDHIGVAVDSSPIAVASDIEKATGIKCFGASVISARALGEAYITNDVPDLCLLKIDDSVECGIVIDKKMYAGENQLGGKIGHMIINFGGFECTCGSKGCFEAYASNSGLRRIAAEAGVANAPSLTHAKLFSMTSPEAESAKKLYVEYLASGITNVINLFQPNELVLEGAFAEAGDALMAPFMETILREQYTHGMPLKCNIRFANSNTATALLGAALLGR